jgi:hypothetical protein
VAAGPQDLVLYRDDLPWVKPFVANYARYRLEPRTQEFGTQRSALLLSQQRIVERAGTPHDLKT